MGWAGIINRGRPAPRLPVRCEFRSLASFSSMNTRPPFLERAQATVRKWLRFAKMDYFFSLWRFRSRRPGAASVFVDELDAGQHAEMGIAASRGPICLGTDNHWERGFRDPAFDDRAARRIPGRSVGEPMNSIPAASRAAFTSSSVDERLGGTSSTASKRLIVLAVTPALLASCSVVQRSAFRAERICVPVII